jgi:PII-like signaling protein
LSGRKLFIHFYTKFSGVSLPIVIEVIDKEEKINEIIKIIEPMITEGLMVIQHDVEIVKYAKSDNK